MDTKKRMYIVFTVLAVIAICIFFVFIAETADDAEEIKSEGVNFPFSAFEIVLSENGKLRFFAEMEKERLINLLQEADVELSAALNIGTYFLPQTIDVEGSLSFDLTDEEEVAFHFDSFSVNGHEIPPKVLRTVGKIQLDFKRSLVYN